MQNLKMKHYVNLVVVFFFMSCMNAKADELGEIFTQTFNNGTGNWIETVGTSDILVDNNQLLISNTTQGASIESVAILEDSPDYQNGEAEMEFYYEGQKNFSLIFRGSTKDYWNWQTIAYNGEGKWTLGQPGGKWIDNIQGPILDEETSYKLLVRYNSKKIEIYLNGQQFYENKQVTYPNQTTINDDWTGKIGIRLFGDRSTLRINSLKSGPVGSILPNQEDSEEFNQMRDRWGANLVGDFEQYPEMKSDKEVANYIKNLSEQSNELYRTINRDVNRLTLWEKVSSDTNSANLTTQFKKLNVLAKAYNTEGTDMYKNNEVLSTIISGIDFMVDKGGYNGKTYFGNWWDWQIGVPQEFVPIMIMLYDEIPQENIDKYTYIISQYLPDPCLQMQSQDQSTSFEIKFIQNFKNSGANRTDQAWSVLGLGLLSEDSNKVYEAVSSINEVFEVVSKGDGFYSDGSFIQHDDIPYTGSYGSVLIKGVGKIFSVVSGTSWEPDKQVQTDFINIIKDAFIPIIVNGETMSFVNGRSLSRAPSSLKNGFGSATIYNLLICSEFAEESTKQELRQAAKYWMVKNPEYYLSNTRDFKDLLLTKELMADSTIDVTSKPYEGSHIYGSMDRFVLSDSEISLGISMYSTRTSAYEAINKENKKGWHTSDGMMYLYNNDGQFGDNYWPTVDWYRLPGTTIDTRELSDETTFKSYRSLENFVGGVNNKSDAVVAMRLNKTNSLNLGETIGMDLLANKSWFVLNGTIICLGSDINGNSPTGIETIIENRMLNSESDYEFIDFDTKDASNNMVTKLQKSDWFLLRSSKENETLGYLMLDEQEIRTEKEERSGMFSEINDAFPSKTLYKETYQKIIIEHGTKVEDGKYAYAIVPGATEELLKEMNKQQKISIIENTKKAQVVKENDSNTIAATVWDSSGTEIEGISVDNACTYIYSYSENNNQINLSVSDPTQENKLLTFKLPVEISEIISKDNCIKMIDKQTVCIDTSEGKGKTFNLTAKIVPVEEEIDVSDVILANNSLEILKKGENIEIDAYVLPENASNKEIQWTSSNESVATVVSGVVMTKKTGITKITGTSKNGKTTSFTVRVTP